MIIISLPVYKTPELITSIVFSNNTSLSTKTDVLQCLISLNQTIFK